MINDLKQKQKEDRVKYLYKLGINFNFYNAIVRPYILGLYKNKCQRCFKSHKRLHIHHISYEKQNKDTLIPLCPSCHKLIHNENKK